MTAIAPQALTVFGGNGWVGSALVAEARGRGHAVTLGDRLPPPPCPGPSVPAVRVIADVIVAAVPGAVLANSIGELIRSAVVSRARLAVVGGSGSLLAGPGGPRLMDADDFREQWKPEARAHAAVLTALRGAGPVLDWFALSPPASFGGWTGTPTTGSYRTGDDVVIVGADGTSEISGADYARAFLDEIESPAHLRRRFTVAR